MPTWCHIYWSMGLDCCEFSQVEDSQNPPSYKSREGCFLVPRSDLGANCCGRLVPQAAACAHSRLWHTELSELKVQVLMLMQVSAGGVQGGHDSPTANRTWESCLDLCFLQSQRLGKGSF